MTGLEKMLREIREEAAGACEAKLAEARKLSDQLIAEAEKEADEACRKIGERAQAREKDLLSRAESAAELTRRKALLAAKQQIIGEVTEKAYRAILDLPTEAYFTSLVKLAVKHSQSGNGVMYFSAADQKRLPSNFNEMLASALSGTGKSLTVSSESRNIDGGFILAYGNIEENCSIRALFDANKETIQDEIQNLLFQ